MNDAVSYVDHCVTQSTHLISKHVRARSPTFLIFTTDHVSESHLHRYAFGTFDFRLRVGGGTVFTPVYRTFSFRG